MKAQVSPPEALAVVPLQEEVPPCLPKEAKSKLGLLPLDLRPTRAHILLALKQTTEMIDMLCQHTNLSEDDVKQIKVSEERMKLVAEDLENGFFYDIHPTSQKTMERQKVLMNQLRELLHPSKGDQPLFKPSLLQRHKM
jgi:hypothetical protein